MRYPVGKLPQSVLAALLSKNRINDSSVIMGPAIGEDAAILDTGASEYLIAKTDPITFTADRIGWYAVQVNANDVATRGGTPRWFLATLLLPEQSTDDATVTAIFDDILHACGELGITLVGGHSEITYGLDRPIVVGHMLGDVRKQDLVRTGGAKQGDAIILTKAIAVEGTALIAREKSKEIAGMFDNTTVDRLRNFIYSPGISVVRDAKLAMQVGGVHSMHDPTEGGLATSLHEMALASNVGISVDRDSIPIFPETQQICRHYKLDPFGLIASGSLLIACEKTSAEPIVELLHSEGIPAAIIGRTVAPTQGVKMTSKDGEHEVLLYDQDEITKVLA